MVHHVQTYRLKNGWTMASYKRVEYNWEYEYMQLKT